MAEKFTTEALMQKITRMDGVLREFERRLFEVEGRGLIEVVTLSPKLNTLIGAYGRNARDVVVIVDPTAGAFTVQMPRASDCGRVNFIIRYIGTSGNAVTFLAQEGETIDGATSTAIYEDRPLYIVSDRKTKLLAGKGPLRFGGASNYTIFESDGTMQMVGDATVYNDLAIPIIPKQTGAGNPSLAVMTGNISEYQFALNDQSHVDTGELLHWGKENTTIEIHAHWATSGLNDATPRGVKWEVEYTWANMEQVGGTIIFPAAIPISGEGLIAANEAALTHKYTTIGTITLSGWKIGAALCMRVKRIASTTTATAPAANPFLLMIGAHIEQDTLGSRFRGTK